MNNVTLIGRLCKDPEVRTFKSKDGSDVRQATFTLAVDRAGDDADFIRCQAYGKTAELVEEWCEKHLGFVPEVTHKKDPLMLWLFDDRTVQVVPTQKALDEGKTLKSSYKDSVIVKLRDQSVPETEKLPLTIPSAWRPMQATSWQLWPTAVWILPLCPPMRLLPSIIRPRARFRFWP